MKQGCGGHFKEMLITGRGMRKSSQASYKEKERRISNGHGKTASPDGNKLVETKK